MLRDAAGVGFDVSEARLFGAGLFGLGLFGTGLSTAGVRGLAFGFDSILDRGLAAARAFVAGFFFVLLFALRVVLLDLAAARTPPALAARRFRAGRLRFSVRFLAIGIRPFQDSPL